jgi:hypothetical protein
MVRALRTLLPAHRGIIETTAPRIDIFDLNYPTPSIS